MTGRGRLFTIKVMLLGVMDTAGNVMVKTSPSKKKALVKLNIYLQFFLTAQIKWMLAKY